MKRAFVWLTAILAVICLCVGCGEEAPADPIPESVKGLVLQVEDGVIISLHTEFEDGTTLTPTATYEGDGVTYYHYANLVGTYRCKAVGSGRYSQTTNIVMTQEDNAQRVVLDVTPEKTAGTGWAPKSFSSYTAKLLAGSFNSDPAQWPAYADILTSPHFTDEHEAHQITTQTRMEEYLAELDGEDDAMYIFSAGASGMYRHDIPLVIFTREDLSSADTLEKAAQCMGQSKPTVLYRAQMHGNEPAGGEAALAMIKWLDGALGEELLDQINICVIPRQNPDGAQNYERTVMGGIDPNRDSLRVRTKEVEGYMQVCQLFEPELIIDGHEYNAQTTRETLTGGDILVGLGYTVDNSEAFRQMNLEMSGAVFGALEGQGMDYRYYSNYVNSANASVSRAYASMQGTLFVLLETRGIGIGLDMYTRRVVAHIVSTERLLRFAAENAQRLQQTVDAERQSIIDAGSVYRTSQTVVLDSKSVEDISLSHKGRKHDQTTGVATQITETPKVYSQVVRSRIAPTAYVIDAKASSIENILKLMDKHGITYTFLPAGSTVLLQQYDSKESDYLKDETSVTFSEGAYVFCKNQVRGLILSMLMEPDVDDVAENDSTLVQQGLLQGDNGCYPLYRYIHDLNAEGFIDYR